MPNSNLEQPLLRVLHIEDANDVAQLVRSYLATERNFPHEILHCTTLSDGIAAFRDKGPYEVVLLDLSLPDSFGLQTVTKFVAAAPDAAVIVMTGNEEETIGIESVKAGAQDFLIKGEYGLLAKCIRYAIERRSSVALRKANVIATESARMREKFIASVSHEMRTPLNAIYGLSNLLDETHLLEEQKQYVNGIQQSAQLLLGIINDILDVSALQYGDIKLEQQDIELTSLLNNLAAALAFKKKEKPIQIKLEIAPNVPKRIHGDGLRLNQILYNLCGNAIKYTDNGEVCIAVHLSGQTDSQLRLRFEVRDTGIGIPADQLPHIFETFKRVETKGRLFEGAGLGLAIVKNLVGLLQGQIEISSVEHVGTTIAVELPFTNAEAAIPLTTMEWPSMAFQNNGLLRILLVEDNRMNMLVARKTIERLFPKAVVVEAEHGGVALLKLAEMPFSLILMDLQMPVVDGYEATKAIRTELAAPINTTPIIAMTANAFVSKEEATLYELGFDDYLLKPFKPEDLEAKIKGRAVLILEK